MARTRNEVIADAMFDGRDGCGCQGCFTIIFLTLVAVTWVSAHGHQILKVGVMGIGIVSAGVLAREALRRMKRGKKNVSAADGPVPLAQIAPGLVHTAGLVGITMKPMRVPLEGAPCVFFRVIVTDDGLPLIETRSADEIVLEDGAGAKLMVKLDDAKWMLERSYEIDSFPNEPNPALDQFLAERGLVARGVKHARVEWIAPHELVFVRGQVAKSGEDADAYRTSDRATFVMTSATIALHEGQ